MQRNTLFKFRRSSQGKRQTVEILLGEFAKSRQPSDLTEKQGGYRVFSKAQAQVSNQSRRSKSTGIVGSTR
jgi:hypothetical protein